MDVDLGMWVQIAGVKHACCKHKHTGSLQAPHISHTHGLQVAVGPGQLAKATSSPDEPRWRTYHYELPLPCAPCQLVFAVGTWHSSAV